MSKRYLGELLKGRSHKEGGIPVRVADDHMVEMEGGEGVVNKRSMSSEKTYEFEGEEMTTCEIVSELNQKEGGGVKFDCDSVEGKEYKFDRGGMVSVSFLPNIKYHIFQLYI
tara:strand:- start:2771 stop:3106 length:336 start_codon:yes stop_codon:yes gene_type:complete